MKNLTFRGRIRSFQGKEEAHLLPSLVPPVLGNLFRTWHSFILASRSSKPSISMLKSLGKQWQGSVEYHDVLGCYRYMDDDPRIGMDFDGMHRHLSSRQVPVRGEPMKTRRTCEIVQNGSLCPGPKAAGSSGVGWGGRDEQLCCTKVGTTSMQVI